VHLDTGSIRHWPRMTHDQLVKVFPDGRTVHVPSDGVPLKGYELAKADIEKRGDGDAAAPAGKLGFLAALFRGKSNDEDDEGATAAVVEKKPQTVAAAAKSADPVPTPRAKPQIAASLQLASADAQIVLPPRPKHAVAASDEPNAKTTADIIDTRGFWGDGSATPQQVTSARMVAAISARRTLETADPQPTSSVAAAYRAMAYAPASPSPVEHANIVVAEALIPDGARPTTQGGVASPSEVNTIVSKRAQEQDEPVTNATRLSAAKSDGLWMRIMMLAPSASTMSVTMLGNADLSMMRLFFVKPQSAIAMSFTDDPMMGVSVDRFSGSAVTRLETTSFVQRTALLH
jgi:hypothetical protein